MAIFYVYKAKASWEKSEKSDVSLRKYEQKTLILGYFCQFWTIFSQKRANFEFSPKKRNCHFLAFMDPPLHEKKQKKTDVGISQKIRTYGRTYVRTDVRAWIHRSPRFLETKNMWVNMRNWFKIAIFCLFLSQNGSL